MKSSLVLVVSLLAGTLVLGITPAWALTAEQQVKLLPADGEAGDLFGFHLALDGDTAIISAAANDDNGEDSGSAYVFTRVGGVWTEQAKLLPADGAGDNYFGSDVALDGDTAVIGAFFDDDNGWESGSAYVFTRVGGVWTEQAKLLPADGMLGDFFGCSVALDGETAVIGAYGNDDNGLSSGSAYVFIRVGNVWTEQAKLLPRDGGPHETFGFSVALDGDTAIIGSKKDYAGSGSAYVFTRTGDVWRQQAKLLPADGAAGDYFGASVALDGETTVIGARYDDDNGEDSGSSYVFTGVGRVWTEQKKLLPADGAAGDRYGLSVAFDGDAAIIGAPQDDDNGEGSGSAYLLARTGGLWTEEDKLLPVDGAIEDWFGLAVAVDGHTAFIGAPYDDDNGSSSGSAYVFRLCDHRITISTDAGDTLIFLTPDPGLFDLVAGNLSDLLIDEDFSHAVCLTPSTANPAVDPLPDPALGEGRYYLGRPLELCQTEGYGDSSLTPDPRDELAAGPCP